ncbi:MAG TPA: helix-turn-helix domain-containing protein [Micromonosporaceae bacterium]
MTGNVISLADHRNRTAPARQATSDNRTTSTQRDEPAEVLPMTGRAVYTVTEVAELLSLSRGSAYALVRSGDIPAVRLGGRWVIPKRRFHAWLDQLPDATTDDIERELNRHR